jgi:dTMP kinase
MAKGVFITFEGIDGCGKSTQFEKVRDYFQETGRKFIVVREPGGTAVGEKIREILLDKKNDSMTSLAELLLYEAARAQITEEVIAPALAEGTSVLCDRFFDSTSAYQGYARGLGSELTDTLNKIATAGITPDITFLLDLDTETAYNRRHSRGEAEDRLEALGNSFQDKVRAGYLECAGKDDRIKVIDATGTPDQIFEEIKTWLSGI